MPTQKEKLTNILLDQINNPSNTGKDSIRIIIENETFSNSLIQEVLRNLKYTTATKKFKDKNDSSKLKPFTITKKPGT